MWSKIRKVFGIITDFLTLGRKLKLWDKEQDPIPKKKPKIEGDFERRVKR